MSADRKHQIIFYLGLPLALGLLLGGARAGMAHLLSTDLALAYWVGSILAMWISFDLGSRIAARILRPWKVPLLIILVAGVVLARVATEPLSHLWFDGFMQGVDPDVLREAALRQAPVFWIPYALRIYYIAAAWIAANYYYLVLLRLPRYGVTPRAPTVEVPTAAQATPVAAPSAPAVLPAPTDSDVLPDFVSQLCPQVGSRLIALAAEDHYVRVHGDLKSALVSYRFADALRDVSKLDGLQVHRSFWAHRAAIRDVRRAGRSVTLEMSNGLNIPVSHAYKELVRRSVAVHKTADTSAHPRTH